MTKSPKVFGDFYFDLGKETKTRNTGMGRVCDVSLRKGKSKFSFSVFPQEPEKQQLYDIPPSPQKAGLGPLASQPHVSMTRRRDSMLGKRERALGCFIGLVKIGNANASQKSLFHLKPLMAVVFRNRVSNVVWAGPPPSPCLSFS